jgi:carbamate kinase
MKPKIEACINYLRDGGKEAIITDPETMSIALEGKGGTVIYR